MDAVKDADALIIVTEWKAYRSPNFTLMRAAMREPVIFDGRNIYEPQALHDAGFTYVGIGRGNRRAGPDTR
jgi:UDPglucose 6-dehydrogenase